MKIFWKAAGTIAAGSLSGGVGSVIAGGKFWDGFRNGAISSALNHVVHMVQQTKRVDWKKSTDQEKIDAVLDSLKDAKNNDLDHLDMRKIFKNYPKLSTPMGNDYIVGNVDMNGKMVEVYMDAATIKDMRFNISPKHKQIQPGQIRQGTGYWNKLEYSAFRGANQNLRYPVPVLSLEVHSSNFKSFYNYLNNN